MACAGSETTGQYNFLSDARADGRDPDSRARCAERCSAGCDASRAAPFVRAGRSPAVRLRRSSAADWPRSDHLPALHRRLHDRRVASSSRRIPSSRSARAPVTRRRYSPRSPGRCTASKSFPTSPTPPDARSRQRVTRTSRCARKWLSGMARSRAVRSHHRHRRASGDPRGAGRPTCGRRCDGRTGRDGISGNRRHHEDARRRRSEADDRGQVRAHGVQAKGTMTPIGTRCRATFLRGEAWLPDECAVWRRCRSLRPALPFLSEAGCRLTA